VIALADPSSAPKGAQPLTIEEVEKRLPALLEGIHPMLLTITSGSGLAIILWLMMFKPL
jgi:hypothetical protein